MNNQDFQVDIDLIQSIAPVPRILDVVCRATGMGFAAVARVTESRWVACQVLDNIHFGLPAGGELPVETTLCHVVRQQREVVVFDDALSDPRYANHITPTTYGLRSYISVPITLSDGTFFGTLCAIDPQPHKVNNPQIIGTFVLFAELIASHIDSARRLAAAERSRERSVESEEAGGIGTFEVDVHTGRMKVSAQFSRLFGLPAADSYASSDIEALVIPNDAEVRSSDASRADGSAPLDVEYRIKRASDGKVRWIARRARFATDSAGKPLTMFGTVHDITERRRLQDHQLALLDLGDRLRETPDRDQAIAIASRILSSALDTARAGYALVERQGQSFRVASVSGRNGEPANTGESETSVFASTFSLLAAGKTVMISDMSVPNELGDESQRYIGHGALALLAIPLLDNGDLVGVGFADDVAPREWTNDEISFVQGVVDRVHAAIEKLDAEQEQQVLNRELGHRMKNQLAMVQAIVNQTMRSAPDLKTASRSLSDRIAVLSRAHDILLTGGIGRTTVEDIVRTAVSLHDDQASPRIHIEGRTLVVGSRPALSLALIVHELATNAAKYGALSTPLGNVTIKWRIVRNREGDQFVMIWEESGGPAVTVPTKSGSGSRLIRAGLAGVTSSSVSVEYAASGLRAEILADLSTFQAE